LAFLDLRRASLQSKSVHWQQSIARFFAFTTEDDKTSRLDGAHVCTEESPAGQPDRSGLAQFTLGIVNKYKLDFIFYPHQKNPQQLTSFNPSHTPLSRHLTHLW